jgi:tetratricopeptide (TPR) repeat protein
MANSNPLVSEISAGLTKPLALLLLCIAPLFLLAQKEKDPLSSKQRQKFNEIFFLAEKQKNLGNEPEALAFYEELHKMDKNNATVCFELAQLYARNNQAIEAIQYGERAVNLDPDNKWFKILLSSIYGKFGEAKDQIHILNELVKMDSLNLDYRYELAQVYTDNRRYKEAIDALNELEAITGINEMITDQKKVIYLADNDVESAVGEMKKLIKAYPKNVEYRGILAQIYMANGQEKKAMAIYEEMLAVEPEDPRPHLDLAQYYQQQKNFEKSIFHLSKAMKSPELDIDKKVAVLMSLFEASMHDSLLRKEAFTMLETLIEQNPNDPKAFAIYGDFLSRDKRDTEALKMYKKAVTLDGGALYEIWNQILLIEIQTEMYDSLAVDGPRAIDVFPNQPLPYFFTGIALSMTNREEEAVDYLESGLLYVIGNPRLKEQFYTQLADVYHKLEEHESSDSYFEKAIALNASNPTVLNNYAYYLSVRSKDLDKALKMSERSNTLAPGNPTFLDTWAWILYQKGQYEEALKKIEQVMYLGGDKIGEVVEHYGDILYKNNRKEDALEQWQNAKKLGDTSNTIDQKIREGKIVE